LTSEDVQHPPTYRPVLSQSKQPRSSPRNRLRQFVASSFLTFSPLIALILPAATTLPPPLISRNSLSNMYGSSRYSDDEEDLESDPDERRMAWCGHTEQDWECGGAWCEPAGEGPEWREYCDRRAERNKARREARSDYDPSNQDSDAEDEDYDTSFHGAYRSDPEDEDVRAARKKRERVDEERQLRNLKNEFAAFEAKMLRAARQPPAIRRPSPPASSSTAQAKRRRKLQSLAASSSIASTASTPAVSSPPPPSRPSFSKATEPDLLTSYLNPTVAAPPPPTRSTSRQAAKPASKTKKRSRAGGFRSEKQFE
jgi:hypothetical protein